jgi:hypothetical protein
LRLRFDFSFKPVQRLPISMSTPVAIASAPAT